MPFGQTHIWLTEMQKWTDKQEREGVKSTTKTTLFGECVKSDKNKEEDEVRVCCFSHGGNQIQDV